MKLTSIGTFLLILSVIGIILPMLVISQTSGTYWRNFRMTVPEEVSVQPGQEVTINASILNTGRFWLRDFNVTLEGLPSDYSYTVTPSHWDELRILRDWNPTDGVFKVPESFLITIKAPATGSGLYAVTVNGTEYASMYKVSNMTKFVLKVLGTPVRPEISSLAVPDTAYVGEAFNVSYTVTNTVGSELQATGELAVPENWTVTPSSMPITLKANESATVSFIVTPQQNVGTVTALVKYIYMNQTLNVTKESLSIIPIEGIQGGGLDTSGWFAGIPAVLQSYSPLLITIVVVIILVIGWIVWSLYGMYGRKRKPESMKKQVETTEMIEPEAQL